MSQKIAFATCRALNILSPDDQLTIEPLWNMDISVEGVAWDNRTADWDQYKAVVLRTTWDYHRRLPEFLSWLDNLENKKIPVWNPPAVIRSNVNKRYLLDFQKAGIHCSTYTLVSKRYKSSVKRHFDQSSLDWRNH